MRTARVVKIDKFIQSESLSLLAYHYLKTVTKQQIMELGYDEQAIFATDYKLRQFCTKASIDYILFLLSKAGFSWTFSVEKNPEVTKDLTALCDGQEQYPQQKVDITEAAAREGIVVISSAETMFNSHMLALDTASDVYRISPFIGGLLDKRKEFKPELQKGSDAFNEFAKLLLEQLQSLQYMERIFDLKPYELRVLLVLFLNRGAAMKMEDVIRLTMEGTQKVYLKLPAAKLVDEGYIIENVPKINYGLRTRPKEEPRTNEKYFMITGKGISKTMDYVKYVHNKVFK